MKKLTMLQIPFASDFSFHYSKPLKIIRMRISTVFILIIEILKKYSDKSQINAFSPDFT